MDDKSTQLLEDILNQQREQTDLLRKNLWRIRFSLRALLILMTLVAVGLGYVANTTRTQNTNARRASVNVIIAPTWPGPRPQLLRHSASRRCPTVEAFKT